MGKYDELKKIEKLSASNLEAEMPLFKKGKRKKEEEYEKLYKDKSQKKNLFFRFNTKKMINKTTQKKTSALGRYTPLKNCLDVKAAKEFSDQLTTEVKTHTPIKKVKKFSDNGTPLIAESKSGETLYLTSDNGVVYHFSNNPELKEQCDTSSIKKKLALDPDFLESAPSKKLKPAKVSQKKVIATISMDLLKEVAKQIKKNKGKRCVSQNKVMGVGANEYAHSAKLPFDTRFEWGHLVAHRFLSDLAQCSKNLAGITKHANTEMMPVEDLIELLASIGEVKIEVTAHLIDKSHIASKIDYHVLVGKHVFPFSFKGQQLNKPDIANKKVLDCLFKVLIAHNKLNTKNATPLDLNTPGMPFMLFSKSANAKGKEEKPTVSHKKSSVKIK